jgi:PKD repeat protein
MQRHILLIIGALLTTVLLPIRMSAQLSETTLPMLQHEQPYRTSALDVAVDLGLLSDGWHRQSLPLQAGYTTAVNINPQNSGEWIHLNEGGYKIWQLVLKPSYYAGIAFYFDRFEISDGSRLFVYSKNKASHIGAFTNKSIGNTSYFATQPIFSDEIVIELEVPAHESDFQINISEIGFVYPYAENERGFGDSGNCNVNVNCVEGQNWQQQKNGITRILVKQGSTLFYCTGSLINNTRNDGTPYLLTANHCGSNASAADYNLWIFDFHYESPECENPLLEPFRLSLTGSQLIARPPTGPFESTSDFKLLLLNQDVPENYKPFYNGWNRQNNITSNGVCIHHPQGDIKKISTFLNQPISTGYGQALPNPDQRYWRLSWSETETNHGVTEGGSSGSPLFDANRRIVGQLAGGGASCTNLQAPDYYGKFSYSWNSNGSNANQQLQPWLDPDNTGIEFLNGIGVDPNLIFAYFEADVNEITINQAVQFEQQSTGLINSYEWFFEGGTPSSSTQELPPPVTYNSFGSFDVSLIVHGQSMSDTLLLKDYIQVRPFLYPNPARYQFILNFGAEPAETIDMQIFDLSGRAVAFNYHHQGNVVTVNLYPTLSGFFIVDVKYDFYRQKIKLVVIR